MSELEACFRHGAEHGFGRRGRGMVEGHAMIEIPPLLLGGVEQGGHDEGRAGEMRHLVIGDRVIHGLRPHRAEADMGAGNH